MMQQQPLRDADLAAFTGSEHWYRHGLTGTLYTDGAKYIAETAGAYWLIDEIALAQRYEKRLTKEEFQVWHLNVGPHQKATLSCEDGNDNILFAKMLDFTDFPQPGIKLYFSDNTIYLPSEY